MKNRGGKLLTKSKFMAGLQCPRYMWIYVNDPGRIPKPDLVTQHTFDQGHEVGEYSQETLPRRQRYVRPRVPRDVVRDILPTLGSQTDLRGGVPVQPALRPR